jgi:hypothetical protein
MQYRTVYSTYSLELSRGVSLEETAYREASNKKQDSPLLLRQREERDLLLAVAYSTIFGFWRVVYEGSTY